MSTAILRCELDVPRCSLTYGVGACDAELGVTGDKKCFNSPATCQDPASFNEETQTIRWVKNSEHIPRDGAIPSLKGVETNAQRITPGEGLGKRERATAQFKNHPYNDTIFDKYISDRDYNPWESGSFWGRFANRYPNIQGYPFRTIREWLNDDGSEDSETSHYFAEEGTINSDMTGYSISARDALTFIEGNKALCPRPSNGTIDRDLNDSSDDTFDLEPSGIGSEYNSLGEYSMGKEYGTFTRSGDTVTLTARGILGSEVETHDAGETFQQAAVFESDDFPQILNTILNIYTDTPSSYVSGSASQWQEEADAFDPRLYTGRIAEPTEVHKLVGELMQDLGLNIYADIISRRLVVRVIRPFNPVETLTDELMSGMSRKTLTDKRISSAYIRYARRNPLEKMDEPSNYRGGIIRFNDDPNIALQELSESIWQHYSRWIPGELRATASETAALMVDRYGQAPQELVATIPREFSPSLAQIVNVNSRVFEDDEGKRHDVPMQVVKVDRSVSNYRLTMEEYRVRARESEGFRLISLTDSRLNMGQYGTMRDIHDSVYGGDTIPDNTDVVFEADPGIVFGSDSTSEFAVLMGSWPELPDGVTLEIRGLTIAGRGGDGGIPGFDGQDGGPALYTRVFVKLTNCTVGGGGGGGAGAAESSGATTYRAFGGGGAGRLAGSGFEDGTLNDGGAGENDNEEAIGGDGGDLGQDGGDGSETARTGGSPGIAIDGDSYVIIDGTTSVLGPRVN